jgi:ribonucleoside-diphosphate reductase alpha chain
MFDVEPVHAYITGEGNVAADMTSGAFPNLISERIWQSKYRFAVAGDDKLGDLSLSDTFARVAEAAASVEPGGKKALARHARAFAEAMHDFAFIPAGRILAGAGTGRAVTLFNCFVMGRIEDDLSAIFENVKEAAVTMQQGGGIGHDFSTLRPRGAPVKSIGADASGPVSFMDVWDAMCRTIMSAGARRGAMMATLRCDHPDIETFIDAKADAARLRNFNLSVLVTDAFMAAVKADAPWQLVFDGTVYRTVKARDLWQRIMRATYDVAEPGVIFIDRVNRMNNLAYCEQIFATNPCGEQPLPPYGACLLGSLNLTRFVTAPFTEAATLDVERLQQHVATAVRFLDNIVEVSDYPLPPQRREARNKRRIGLGVTGLADALILVGERYGSPDAVRLAGTWLAALQNAAYLASAELAAEKGSFPLYDAEAFLARPNVQALQPSVRSAIARHGMHNGCLTSIAPTGTISLLAGNVSSGIEPVFDLTARRRVLQADGMAREEVVEDAAYRLFRARFGPDAPLPSSFVTAAMLTPAEHLAMQAAVQPHVDSSISKTINVPADIAFEAFESIYLDAYAQGLKGCTTYRPNDVTGAVLQPASAAASSAPPSVVAAAPPLPASAPVRLATEAGAVVYMSKPLERDPVLEGYTYKLKWPESDHAIYVTINDIVRDGRRCPFEIFINTRNLEHYAWTVALTRMISAVFRRGGDVAFVAEELKGVFDPQGGRWIKGRYVPSLLAAIGEVIEAHMVRIGFLSPRETPLFSTEQPSAAGDAAMPLSSDGAGTQTTTEPFSRRAVAGTAGARHCPRCSSRSFVRSEGCWICQSCGFSRCG